MSQLHLTKLTLRNGTWEGLVTGAEDSGARPDIQVTHMDQPVPGIDLTEADSPGNWTLRIPIPAEAIAEGVQTFLIRDAASDTKLGSFTLIAGEAADDDLRAEVELLRAELDMLKRAFRRHCLETA